MDNELTNLITFFINMFVIISVCTFIPWLLMKKRKDTDNMRKNIIAKLTNKIELSAKDIVHIGKSFDLNAFQSRKVVYRIFRDADTIDSFNSLNKLVQEIEIQEPYDDLPDEVKPSLIRMKMISENTEEESDKYILSPIVNVLGKYVEQKNEQEKLKKRTNRAYVITIVSFAIGAISFYFTLKSPTAEDIAKEIQRVSIVQTIEH